MPAPTMHADEIATDAALVRRLLAGQFPAWAGLPIRPVPSAGTDNALYRLGDSMVVRLPRIHWAVESVDREHRWLPFLGALLPLAIPVPLGRGTPAEGYPWPWSVYGWLRGENPTVDGLSDPHRLATEIAAFLTALRRIDPADGPPAGQTLGQLDQRVRRAIDESRGLVDSAAVVHAWDAALKAPDWRRPPVWLHGDMAPGNILLVDDRLRSVIDFSGVGVGDPSIDLRIAWNLLPRSARDHFRESLAADDATWARGRGRALAQALFQLPYYKDTNRDLAANARHVIREVLADHRRLT